MMPVLCTHILIGLLIFLVLAIVGRRKVFRNPAILFFLIYFIDNLVITLTNHLPGLQFVPNHIWGGFLLWGWSGKTYSILIVLVLLLAYRPMLSFEDVGIAARQDRGSIIPSLGVILLIAAWSSLVGSRAPQGKLDIEMLLYLAILPGVNEELVYRGILPACLDRLFSKNWVLASARIGWSTVIASALFGLLHGLWLDDSFALHIEIILIRNALLSGFIFAWLRERTGSLVMPIIAHGVWDFFLFLVRMI